MINEKKLVEELKENNFDILMTDADCFGLEKCTENVIELINKQPKVGEWIPYSERVPEKTGYYLVQLSRKLPNEDYADRVVVLYNGEDKEFMAYERLIIAWQPIPEPYKGE